MSIPTTPAKAISATVSSLCEFPVIRFGIHFSEGSPRTPHADVLITEYQLVQRVCKGIPVARFRLRAWLGAFNLSELFEKRLPLQTLCAGTLDVLP